MMGHLTIGNDLINAERREEGLTHFAHPRAELFDDFAKIAAPDRVAALETALKDLLAAASAQEDFAPAYAAAADALWGSLEDEPSPADVARILSLVTAAAADEYAEAVKDGAVVNLAEYQDGKGFVSVAQGWLRGQAGAVLKGADAQAADALAAAVTELAAAWPTLDAPAAPADPAKVRAAASRVELKASAFR